MRRSEALPKYQQVFNLLHHDIVSGRLRKGERVPSEAELVRTFGASRITVGRALRDLQRAGLVERRAGSGTFVAAPRRRSDTEGRLFGLLVPDLGETEILDPICQGVAAAPAARGHSVIWGGVSGVGEHRERAAWELCQRYVERRVAGVFFAPLELTPGKDALNQRIVETLEAAGIPVVLLDRPVAPYGEREAHDLVGIDNRRAGFRVTEHLLRAGARQLAFASLEHAAPTVDARRAGFREALRTHGVDEIRAGEGGSIGLRTLAERDGPDGIVCANDHTAGLVMRALLDAGRAIPGDVRLVGIDDVRYASLLPVPLTTLRQPCEAIGAAAMTAMLERLATPPLPPRDIFLHPTLVVRDSCGSRRRE